VLGVDMLPNSCVYVLSDLGIMFGICFVTFGYWLTRSSTRANARVIYIETYYLNAILYLTYTAKLICEQYI
jgi:hypothetical protein